MSDRSSIPTINDVARAAGVSKGLVSFVFNGRPGVAPETKDRIIRAADDLGWRPSHTARTLSTRRALAHGLVLRRDPSVLSVDAFFPAFLAGAESVLSAQGWVMVLAVVPDAETEHDTYRRLAVERRVDGVIVTDLRHHDRRLPLLDRLGLPAVTLGRPDLAAPVCVVEMDDTAGIARAVEHLYELGHRRIAHVAGDPDMLHGRRRRLAFERAVAGCGLDPQLVVDTDFSPAAGAQATRELLLTPSRPTAIVYANDQMAVAGLAVLTEHGMDVPADMSIVGHDGSEMTRYLYPSLTTVESDPALWGATAARSLLQVIDQGRATDVQLPPARFVLGRSTAPPSLRSQS